MGDDGDLPVDPVGDFLIDTLAIYGVAKLAGVVRAGSGIAATTESSGTLNSTEWTLTWADDATNSPWNLGWSSRGLAIEETLGGNLPRSFPTIDAFTKGTVTRIKSIDLTAATYQKASRLAADFTRYVDSVAGFNASSFTSQTVAVSDILARELGWQHRTRRSEFDAVWCAS